MPNQVISRNIPNGTHEDSFQLDQANGGPKIKKNGDTNTMAVRNGADTAYAHVKSQSIKTHADGEISLGLTTAKFKATKDWTLNASKTTAEETTMISGWGSAEEGREWNNTTTHKKRRWNGSAVEDIPGAGGSSSAADYIMTGFTTDKSISGTGVVPLDKNFKSNGVTFNTGTGVFTLAANKTYVLKAGMDGEGSSSGGFVSYKWYDITNTAYFGIKGRSQSENRNTNIMGQVIAVGYITTTETTTVKLDIIEHSIINTLFASASFAEVQELIGAGSGGGDSDAIHDNVAAEINAITEKTTPVSADLILIEDSADSNNKKKVQLGNLPGGGGGGASGVPEHIMAGFSTDKSISGTGTVPLDNVFKSNGVSLNTGTYIFTLAANKTYVLKAGMDGEGSGSGFISYKWYNITDTAYFGIKGRSQSENRSTNIMGQILAVGYITTTETTTVRLDIIEHSVINTLFASASFAEIQELAGAGESSSGPTTNPINFTNFGLSANQTSGFTAGSKVQLNQVHESNGLTWDTTNFNITLKANKYYRVLNGLSITTSASSGYLTVQWYDETGTAYIGKKDFIQPPSRSSNSSGLQILCNVFKFSVDTTIHLRIFASSSMTDIKADGSWAIIEEMMVGGAPYGITATSAINYTLSIDGIDTLVDGANCIVKFHATASGSATLDVNGLGAKKLFKASTPTSQINNGDIQLHANHHLVYNSSLDTFAGGWCVMGT